MLFLGVQTVIQFIRFSTFFTRHEGSVPYSQKFISAPCQEPLNPVPNLYPSTSRLTVGIMFSYQHPHLQSGLFPSGFLSTTLHTLFISSMHANGNIISNKPSRFKDLYNTYAILLLWRVAGIA